MNRLLSEFHDGKSLNVLINNETTLFLLLDNRHVKYEKTNIGFLFNKSVIESNNSYLKPSDVIQLVSEVVPNLYVTDISDIKLTDNEYVISIDPECLIYFGSFKIKLKNKGI